MAGHSRSSRCDKPSIKYRCNPLEGAYLELVHEEYAPSLSNNDNQCNRSDPKTSEILSTSELISTVGQIWGCASRPLSILHSRGNWKLPDGDCRKENVFCYMGNENGRAPISPDSKYFCVDLKTACFFPAMVQPKFEPLKSAQNMFLTVHGSGNYTPFFWRFLHGATNKVEGLASVAISYDLGNIYKWMSEIPLVGQKSPATITQIEVKNVDECCSSGDGPVSCCISKEKSIDFETDSVKCKESSCSGQENVLMNTDASVTSLHSDYFIGAAQSMDGSVHNYNTSDSQLHLDYHVNFLTSGERQHKTEDDDLLEKKPMQHKGFVFEDKPQLEIHSPMQDKPHYALPKQKHAFAGALAGILVSLCLHPVDTIKTVIQSRHTDQKSIWYFGRSIVSERGLSGLYRGISSNIASSAPISAVYTFTYESVKGALLPLLPKEYYSFAHCMAGGCASIATSFIFTPSERIKQQMQVGSHYKNSWNALVGIIKKGGIPSLYAGWGAVLCRNVPHSVIKFYTYESLKQLMLSTLQPNDQLNTFQTLVCGGLAGSTAALFTTPFDVVKTRLQTQIPGSMNQYNSVYHGLQQIGKHDGLRGLYRGLTPRLIMYMSQGALFFASYESFKRLLSVEVPRVIADTRWYEQNVEDELESPSYHRRCHHHHRSCAVCVHN